MIKIFLSLDILDASDLLGEVSWDLMKVRYQVG